MTSPAYDLQLRPATEADFDGLKSLMERAFGEEIGPGQVERGRRVFEPERYLVFAEGDRIVANAGAFTRDLTVPGGAAVPAAHVTAVAVHPTHRRRGLLTRLMHTQLRSVRETGREPLAVLWASEGKIYQRFGYGMAVARLSFEADRRDVRFLPRVARGGGRLRELSPADARKDLVELYERLRPERPGWSSREERWWDFVLSDPTEDRHSETARHALLYEAADGVAGYALWRTRRQPGARGATIVREVVAATPEAYAELWRFLLSVDLTRTTEFWCAGVDEPLLYLIDEPSSLGARYADALWVRIVDVPVALAARAYAAPVDVVFEVTDVLLPENAGRWRLRAGPGSAASCEATGEPADLSCDVADLGAVYLGGTGLATLAAAGRVAELRPGALAAAGPAFAWTRAPSATEVF